MQLGKNWGNGEKNVIVDFAGSIRDVMQAHLTVRNYNAILTPELNSS